MAVPEGSYPAPPPTVRFDVISQAFQLLQQQMGQWVLLILVYLVAAGLAILVLSFIPLVGSLLGGVPAMILVGGAYKAALKQMRGGTVAVSDLFDVGDVVGQLIVVGILVGLGTSIAALFCVLPAFVVGGLWMFAVPLVVDRGMDGVAAMRESWNALRREWVMAAVFYLVVGLIAAVGGLLCGIGLLFTLPIVILATTLLYRDFFPEHEAPSEPGVPPVAF